MKTSTSQLTFLLVAAAAFAAGMQDDPPPGPPDENDWRRATMPGKEHERLEVLIGTWSAQVRLRPQPRAAIVESTATIEREWVLGGRFVRETVGGVAPDGTPVRYGIGYMGFNAVDGLYEIAWLEGRSTAIHFERGTYDAVSETITFRGLHREPPGRLVPTRTELRLADERRLTLLGYTIGPDGREFRNVEITMTRDEGAGRPGDQRRPDGPERVPEREPEREPERPEHGR